MKKNIFYLVCVLLFAVQSGFSQPAPYDSSFVDSLKIWLPKSPDDEAKVDNLARLAGMHLLVDPALTIKYAKEGLGIAKQINYHNGMISCLGQSGFCYAIIGEWPKALHDVREAIPLCEKYNPVAMTYMCNIMVVIFATKGDNEQALQWAQKAAQRPEFKLSEDINKWPTYMQLGMMNENLNYFDSANHYAEIVKSYIKKYSNIPTPLVNDSYSFLGSLNSKQGNYEEAIQYYRLAKNYVGLAHVYHKTQNSDSAIYYARLGLGDGQEKKFPGVIQEASKILAAEYKLSNPVEANKFLNIYIDSRDSLYNTEKLKQVEEIELNNQRAEYEARITETKTKNKFIFISLFIVVTFLVLLVMLVWRNNQFKQKANTKLQLAYNNLESTQAQLIQSEKMASLGELTAGIAHEIQNPLNFVNNFSEVSTELVEEMKAELATGNQQLATEIANDLKQNLEKINHHGKRAGDIVKGMLQHSRSSSGVREPTNINALADEYLRLAYHGLRAKDKSFNATMKTEFDETICNINIIPQDIGRVILNLITNAFYAVNQQRITSNGSYEPTVSVSTKKEDGKVLISVKDNGNGIPDKIKDKIFQPFFTTKPTGQGTGLGLSLSYDIVKAHGGELKLETRVGEGTTFIIKLPNV